MSPDSSLAVTYTLQSPDAARIAIAEMADQLILGRPCRTEQGKVERK